MSGRSVTGFARSRDERLLASSGLPPKALTKFPLARQGRVGLLVSDFLTRRPDVRVSRLWQGLRVFQVRQGDEVVDLTAGKPIRLELVRCSLGSKPVPGNWPPIGGVRVLMIAGVSGGALAPAVSARGSFSRYPPSRRAQAANREGPHSEVINTE